MKISSALVRRRDDIHERWCDLVFSGYSADTADRLKKEKDRFLNPVGYAIARNLGMLVDGLLQGRSGEYFHAPLTNIIKIRATQQFCPSDAIGFLVLFKRAVEGAFGDAATDISPQEMAELYLKIDDLILLAMDIYVDCRQKLHEIALKEVRKGREEALALLRRFEYGKPGKSNGSEELGRRID